MNIIFHTTGLVAERMVDGYSTTAVAISDKSAARAIALVYAGFGDGPEVARLIVRAVNAHEDLLAALQKVDAFLLRDDFSNAPMNETYARLAQAWVNGAFGSEVRAAIAKAKGAA